ncbi:HNH endonuclease [Salmonella enterica subsp. enterica]|nr:HNH endonuclease [Salmonella enterica subsp. enterica]
MDLEGLYLKLIAAAESRNGKPPKEYRSRLNAKQGYETHHIMPRSLGGSDRPYNLVYLTPREHYTAHHMLARLFGGDQAYAFHGMSLPIQGNTGRSYTVTARQYATARALLSDYLRGRQFTDESRERMSKGQRLRFETQGVSAETRARISASNMGRKPTDETRAKLRAANLKQYEGLEFVTCPHCGKSGGGRVMARWHFGNCPAFTGKSRQKQEYEKITCPHCGLSVGKNIATRYHFDNCKAIKKHKLAPLGGYKICSHCGTNTTAGNYARWHGDNCKHKP